jgi:hypothetical protein
MEKFNGEAEQIRIKLYSFYDRRVNVSLKKDPSIYRGLEGIIREALEEAYKKGYKEGKSEDG